MSDFPSNLISSLLGTIIGATLAYWFALRQFKIQEDSATRQMRVDTGLAFHEELTSSDFARARSEANKVFEEHVTASRLSDFYSSVPEEKKQYVRMVLAFFRRLHLVIKYERIDNQMVVELLSGEFFWWYFHWLDKMIPADWDTRKDIDGINNWLQHTMPRVDYELAKTAALKGREERIAKLITPPQVS